MAKSETNSQPDPKNVSPSVELHLKCGYHVFDIGKINDRWKCIYCQLIIKEPMQLTECGHRCCTGCFKSRAAVVVNDDMICPEDDCKVPFHKDQVRRIYCQKNTLIMMDFLYFTYTGYAGSCIQKRNR